MILPPSNLRTDVHAHIAVLPVSDIQVIYNKTRINKKESGPQSRAEAGPELQFKPFGLAGLNSIRSDISRVQNFVRTIV